MKQFDVYQVKMIEPFLNKVVLHFPFYANTFPIAYHYYMLLKNSGKSDTEIKEYIKLHDWNDVFPSKSDSVLLDIISQLKINSFTSQNPTKINLFYTSELNLTDIYTYVEKFEGEEVCVSRFTDYRPVFFFINNNLYNQRFFKSPKDNKHEETIYGPVENNFHGADKLDNFFYTLSEILKIAQVDGINSLSVYTETINEARDIFGAYASDFEKIYYYDKNSIGTLNFEDKYKNGSRNLDIFYYGAPTSFHFLTQKDKFIPCLLNDFHKSSGIGTVAVLHYNRANHNEEDVERVNQGLNFYHKHLFDAVFDVKGPELFNNVRLAYNKYAKLVRHDSFFYSPESFAKCIALHDSRSSIEQVLGSVETTEKSELKISTVNSRNIHIHYGAGKLAIGLILAIIKPEGSLNRLIVIQKNRKESEWNKYIYPEHKDKKIQLSNSDKWKLELSIVEVDEVKNVDTDCFVFFKEFSQLDSIITMATSISYSLNDTGSEAEFLKYLAKVQFAPFHKILLFPFENKPLGRKERSEILKEKFETISDIRVKADRICLERTFDFPNKAHVICEEHIEVVLNMQEYQSNNLFDLSKGREKQILFIGDNNEYNYLSKRKEYLVNELHFILAVYGYDFLISKQITHWEEQYVTIIQSALTSDPNYKIPIDTFIRLQIIRLLSSSDQAPSIAFRYYGLVEPNIELIYEHLVKYANGVTKRFTASKEDRLTRVFNTDDASAIQRKYKTIVQELRAFIEDGKNRKMIEEIPMSDAGTYLEYQGLIGNFENKFRNILSAKERSHSEKIEKKDSIRLEEYYKLREFRKKIDELFQNEK